MGPEKLDTSTADILTGIGKHINTFGSALAEEKKAEAKKLKEERDKLNKVVKEKSSSQKEIEKKKQDLKEKFGIKIVNLF